MGIYLGSNELGGGGGGAGASGGYIPGVVGYEFLALSGGGAGVKGYTYGAGGGGGGTLIHSFAYGRLNIVIPITVGAGGPINPNSIQASGGSSVLGEGLFVTTVLGGGGGSYTSGLTNDFGTCAGGRGDANGNSEALRNGNGFDNRGRVIGILGTTEVNSSTKNINDPIAFFTNGRTQPFSGPGGAGLGGSAATSLYNNGTIGGIGLDPTTITDRFLTQAEFISEGIGEVTSSVAYIGGGGSGHRSSGRANPPGGCGAIDVAGLANTGGGGGAGATGGSGGSGFVMLRLPTSQSVTTTGTVSTYTKGNDTVYVWKSTGSITLNS